MESTKRGKREEIQNIIVDISDGQVPCKGIVLNVSLKGLAITDIPSKFIEKACAKNVKRFTAIVSSDTDTIRITLIPRWANKKEKNSVYANAGFEIANELSKWQHFVMHRTSIVLESNEDDCVWGKNNTKYLRV